MARYFHVTTPAGTTTTKVPEGWFPTIAGGMLTLPDGTEIEASAISASRFESKRETPARDRLVSQVQRADLALTEAIVEFRTDLGIGTELEDSVLLAAFVGLKTAHDIREEMLAKLKAHDDNVKHSREAAAEKKKNPPAPQAPAAKTKAPAKPKTPKQ